MMRNLTNLISNSLRSVLLILSLSLLAGCQSARVALPTEPYVDLDSFMGTWYVVGYTPILVDGDAHNATEHYALAEDGRILTTYQFRDGAFDGPLKTFKPTAFVRNEETNSEWGMQFIWPFKASYLILHYDEALGETVIAHPSRKYAWIMLREPFFEEETYDRLLGLLVEQGFDPSVVKRLPHNWTNDSLLRE